MRRALGLLLLAGCSDNGLSLHPPDVAAAAPHIAVDPARLDFWDVASDEEAVLSFTVWSTGDAQLAVDDLVLTGDSSFTFVDDPAGFDLPEGDAKEIAIAFTPLGPGAQTGQVEIASDDADAPLVTVDLVGNGRVPSLAITPDPWDFGTLPLGCAATVDLTLQNVGNEALDIASWSFDGGAGLSLVPGTDAPRTLAPYAYTTVTVAFTPLVEGAAAGTFSVVSNDPRGTVVATQAGSGLGGEQGADHFTTDADPPVDVLLAVDQSASMDDDAASLGGAFASFIDTIGAVTSDWHLGVATTDDGCFNGGVLTATTPDLATTFADAVSYGEDRDIVHDEALLQLSAAALADTGGADCNAGFLRAGALLHVIVVSDEPERSTEEASAWTWDHWVDRFDGYVPTPSLLMVSGVVDTDGCNEGDAGYAEAIAATDGELLSICSGDWSDRLATLASASVRYAWTFTLSAEPVEDSLVVLVDGVALADGWHYDATLGAVVVDSLAAGATVDVTYDIAAACP
jgi:hypothetical protein